MRAKGMDFDVAAVAHEVIDERGLEGAAPEGGGGFTGDDGGGVAVFGVAENSGADAGSGKGDGFAAELFGEAESGVDAGVLRLAGIVRGFDESGGPFGAEGAGKAGGGADELGGEGARADADEETLGDVPGVADGVGLAVFPHLRVDAVSGAAEGHFAEGDEVAGAEEILSGPVGLIGDVDFAFFQALDEFVGGEIDEFNFVGLIEDGIGERFADDDAGDLSDDIVEAFQVLDVDGGVDADAGFDEFENVLPAFGVAAAGGVGVGEFVDKDKRGAAEKGGVEIEFRKLSAFVADGFTGENGETGELGFGLLAAMSFDVADDDVDTGFPLGVGGLQHGIGFADTGGRAEENFQAAMGALRGFGLDACEDFVGIGAVVRIRHGLVLFQLIEL